MVAFRRNGYNNLVDVLTQTEQFDAVIMLTDGFHQFQEWSSTTLPNNLDKWRIPFGDNLEQLDLLSTSSSATPVDIGQVGAGDPAATLAPVPLSLQLNQWSPQSVTVASTNASYFYTHDAAIGTGLISTVLQGTWNQDPNWKVAIKYINRYSSLISREELAIAKRLFENPAIGHMNVCSILAWSPLLITIASPDPYWIITELAQISLSNAIQTNWQNLSQNKETLISLLDNIAQGLEWLHDKQQVSHGNIHPKNVLLFLNAGQGQQQPIAKLGDFGYQPKLEHQLKSWLSPEALVSLDQGKPFQKNKQADIFSFGLVCHWSLNSGTQHPFDLGNGKVINNLKDKQFKAANLDESAHYCFPVANNLLQWMLQKEAARRPDIGQVKGHPLFWGEVKSFQFLEEFFKCLTDNRQGGGWEWKEIWEGIDKLYLDLKEGDFEWMGLVDEKMFEKRAAWNFNGKSLICLVELITQAEQDYRQDLIGQGLRYSRKDYAEHFLVLFPDMVISLWGWGSRLLKFYPGVLGNMEEKWWKPVSNNGENMYGNCWRD